ncbi:MAG: hypothetical protein RPU61_04555 [Candidatus Sedimenticola sp. (ex Thyasira tokunagai)]
MKYYTLFNPADVTPELEAELHALSTCGNMMPVILLGDRWYLASGVRLPSATQSPARLEGESDVAYATRVAPGILALFAAGLPGGLSVSREDLRLIMASPEWRALVPPEVV